ncbi:MAG: helix-turn-helix domain-containing protein [Micrococcales bacterium]|nr:helix-turn-helix domain-containing protein [Micrococcales bacterium]MCL2667934.1 helix-turn-helix domain-containing protein [Micrococcales bacterium]
MTAVRWSEVRAKRVPDENAVAVHRERMATAERAWRLREIREAQGVTQKELAERLGLTQPTISTVESGDMDRSALATLRAYVEALGGQIEVAARFGDRTLILSSGQR